MSFQFFSLFEDGCPFSLRQKVMAYISIFQRTERWTDFGHRCILDSDIELDFCVYKATLGNLFSVMDGKKVIAEVTTGEIPFTLLPIEKVKLGMLTHGWALNESKDLIVSINSHREFELEGKIVGKISSGGFLFNSICTLLTKRKWVKPEPYHRVDFDTGRISPRIAMCLLISKVTTNPA